MSEQTPDFEQKAELAIPQLRPQEFAEQYATAVFGEDAESRNLLRTDILTGLRGEEKDQLAGKLAAQEVPEVLRMVKIYHGEHVEIAPGESGPKFLLTNELNGCTATVIFTEQADGRREAAMAHFPDIMTARHVSKLGEIVTEKMRSSPKKSALIFAADNRQESVAEIQTELRALLGEEADVQIESYKKSDEADYGVLLVRVPPAGREPASAHATGMNRKM